MSGYTERGSGESFARIDKFADKREENAYRAFGVGKLVAIDTIRRLLIERHFGKMIKSRLRAVLKVDYPYGLEGYS